MKGPVGLCRGHNHLQGQLQPWSYATFVSPVQQAEVPLRRQVVERLGFAREWLGRRQGKWLDLPLRFESHLRIILILLAVVSRFTKYLALW